MLESLSVPVPSKNSKHKFVLKIICVQSVAVLTWDDVLAYERSMQAAHRGDVWRHNGSRVNHA